MILRPRSSGRRGGFTLIEMMVVISATTMFSLVFVRIALNMMELETAAATAAARALTLQRLEDQFREDAHEATSARWTPGEERTAGHLTLQREDRVARYEVHTDHVAYLRTGAGRAIRENYPLFGGRVEFVVEDDWVQLRYGRREATRGPPPADDGENRTATPHPDDPGALAALQVSARIGLQRRFLPPASASREEQP